jgi:hypothetical protein
MSPLMSSPGSSGSWAETGIVLASLSGAAAIQQETSPVGLLPLIAKVDRYLAGWQALLLNPAGRLVLINSVLDGLPTYLMAALPLPPAVEDKMDARHRAFIWTGSSQASGAQCLVAWAKASLSKENGGLGIKRVDC